ncbi:MAG: 3-deoxy-D-manno-octulosonic acid transferase [Flavisolibacter sp.]
MLLLYNFTVQLYFIAVRIAALWNKKAVEWISGRKNLFASLEQKITATDKIIWMHCSSAGEFEQGKPAIEKLKSLYPHHKILVSFFSPSGYHVAKNYQYADIITYLPLDTRQNARRFIEITHPDVVVFVKYEFWYHHLSAAAFKHIPLLLISAVFRENQAFFKWYGRFYKQMLFLFRHIFVQDESSLQLLKQHGIDHCSIGGDTRFDRVQEIAEKFTEIPFINDFAGDAKLIVAGSTWPDDEQLLSHLHSTKLIIAPHEINEPHLAQIEKLFSNSIRYSQWQHRKGNEKVLLIDNVGMLSRLYKYAAVAYIGGGFTKDGIHNILEAAVYGKPAIFGPNYKKYREAKELVARGGAFSAANSEELKITIANLLNHAAQFQKASAQAQNYVLQNRGATEKIIQFIQENRLLTK